ncbi:MAG: hypothetical protein K2M07_03570 [Muribaculaceae bacterium]|nr:hypothetical protein [Muribaculaceae bacterium]
MRNLISLILLLPFLLCAETVNMRSLDLSGDTVVVHDPGYPAWNCRTRLVCGKSFIPWNLLAITEHGDTVTISFSWQNRMKNSFEPVTTLVATVEREGVTHTGEYAETPKGRISGDDYMITLSWDMTHGLSLECGNNMMLGGIKLDVPLRRLLLDTPAAMLFPEWLTRVETISPLHGKIDEEYLSQILENPKDSITGIYKYFDRDNDPALALPGGDYSIAVVPVDGSEDYAIVYLDSATVNPALWQRGMVKGIMSPTNFERQYSLRWIDAEFHDINAEQYAMLMDGGLLQMTFPLYKSKLRFEPIRY